MDQSNQVTWSYYNKLEHENDTIKLVGFMDAGSIITKSKVEYANLLELKFSLLVYPDAYQESAVVDIDFWDGSKNFISGVIMGDKISFIIKENYRVKHLFTVNHKYEWIDIYILLNFKDLLISINNVDIEYKFKSIPGLCTVAFGNNVKPLIFGEHNRASFGIKNIYLKTGYNDQFPLIIDNLHKLDSFEFRDHSAKKVRR